MQQLDTVIDGLQQLVAGTTKDQLTNPTPCAKWTVRDLLNHFTAGGHMFAAAFRGQAFGPEVLAGPMPDLVGDDHVAAAKESVADFRAAVREPGALDRTVSLPIGDLPGAAVIQLATFDLLVHSWDLATATGQPFQPDDGLVAAAEGFARTAIGTELRDGDTFADETACAADARPIERLAAFAGRSV